MNKVIGVSGVVAAAYYALSLIFFLSREVEGSAFARFLRVFVVAYYGFMTCAYLLREVVMKSEEPPVTEESAEVASS